MSVFIYDAVRTPRGKARPDGSLAAIKPQDLVAGLVEALETRVGDVRGRAGMFALGCVGQIGAQGGNIALVSKFRSGLPDTTPACTINNYCVSGLTAIGQSANAVTAGQIDFALAGGVESMSRVPFMGDKADFYAEAALPPNARYMPVVVAADMLAMDRDVSRTELDAVTVASHQKAAAAETDTKAQRSRIAVKRDDGTTALDKDEAVRASTSSQSLARLQPAFAEVANAYKAVVGNRTIDHRHTIAHAPPVSDGAGLAFIGRGDGKPRAKILAYAEAGGDPRASLTAGFAAMDKALKQAKVSLADIDRVEFMEAFAVTIAMFLRDYDVDAAKVNALGGHLGKGHPLGASGAILLSTLLDSLDAGDGTLGLVVASGASGIGAAMIVERLN
ncbi:MAG: acetyl-CoA C-acyltransferase [Xanthobacteraceae bacterium]